MLLRNSYVYCVTTLHCSYVFIGQGWSRLKRTPDLSYHFRLEKQTKNKNYIYIYICKTNPNRQLQELSGVLEVDVLFFIYFYQQVHVYTVFLFSFSFLFQWYFFGLKKALLVFWECQYTRSPCADQYGRAVRKLADLLTVGSNPCSGPPLLRWEVMVYGQRACAGVTFLHSQSNGEPAGVRYLLLPAIRWWQCRTRLPLAFCILSVRLRLGHGTARETELRN